MHSLVLSVRVDVVLVQACGSSRNRWSHHYYYGVIGTSTSGLGMYLVLRYGEILRFAETCSCALSSPTWRLHCSCGFYLSVCQKSPLQGLGSDTKEIFLLASKLLVVYQAFVYPTAFPLYCHLSPLPPFPTGSIFDFALELLITIILGSRTKHELVRITAA